MHQTVAAPVPFEPPCLMRASFMRGRGLMVEVIERRNGGTVRGDSGQLRQSLLDYANDGTVAVRSFCSTMRDLKAITR